MWRKPTGWLVFIIGCYLVIINTGAVITGSPGNILGVFLGLVITRVGWATARSKKGK